MLRCIAALCLLLVPAVPAVAAVDEAVYARVNASLVARHVLPRYQRLAEATQALETSAAALCAGPNSAGLASLRQAFDATMEAWMGVQHIRFGPIELYQRLHRIYFWPEARGRFEPAIRELLAIDPAALVPEKFAFAALPAQGLPALEILLNADGIADRRCPAAAAIAVNLKRMATATLAEWRDGDRPFDRAGATAGPGNKRFETARAVTLELFKSLHAELQLIADVKLKPVLGESAEAARPKMAESRRSGRSARNVIDNLEALQALYLGEGGPGFAQIADADRADEELGPLLRRAFELTLETARALDRPLEAMAADPAARPAVEKLLTQVLALKQLVRTRLAKSLGLSEGFNALDGD